VKIPRIQCRHISGDELSGWAEGDGLKVNRTTFFYFISYMNFEKAVNEAKLKCRFDVYTLSTVQWVENSGDDICERSGRLCLLVDEMSFEDADIRVEDFSGITGTLN
jgi:hypothetical protein